MAEKKQSIPEDVIRLAAQILKYVDATDIAQKKTSERKESKYDKQ